MKWLTLPEVLKIVNMCQEEWQWGIESKGYPKGKFSEQYGRVWSSVQIARVKPRPVGNNTQPYIDPSRQLITFVGKWLDQQRPGFRGGFISSNMVWRYATAEGLSISGSHIIRACAHFGYILHRKTFYFATPDWENTQLFVPTSTILFNKEIKQLYQKANS